MSEATAPGGPPGIDTTAAIALATGMASVSVCLERAALSEQLLVLVAGKRAVDKTHELVANAREPTK